MDGIELFKKIREKDKKIKVCFVSAYDVDYHTVKEYSTCIIKKPVTIEDLLKKINIALEYPKILLFISLSSNSNQEDSNKDFKDKDIPKKP